MPLAKVRGKYQVTIPRVVRKAVGLSVGDVLETAVRGNTILMRPQSVVDRGSPSDAAEVAKALGFASVAALRKAVEQEARANASEDRRIAAEWSPLDEEAWQRHGR